jgi:hypothetical protein
MKYFALCTLFFLAFAGSEQKTLKPIIRKVLVINFDPVIRSKGNERLHKVFKWNDPHKLTKEYIKDLEECSGGYVRYKVIQWVDVDEFPQKIDGYRYSEEEYLNCFSGKSQWHQPDGVNYKYIIEKFNIAERVNKGEIDEVWLWGAPYMGYWESLMVGKRAYECNSPPLADVDCKPFIIMGFNYERGVGEMLEDFGHRVESIMTHIYGSWEAKETHAWNRFTLYDKVAPGKAGCGNVHYAPNSKKDYDWGNKRYVWSTCDDWLTYPKLTGKKRLVNCSEWGNGDIRFHHKWWLKHLPRSEGRGPDGKLNNWWAYIVNSPFEEKGK